MANKQKKSFFERLTGSVGIEDDEVVSDVEEISKDAPLEMPGAEGQLGIDMFQTPNEIIIRAMVAGVRPEDLQIDIGREAVTIRGERQEKHEIHRDDYVHRELYWGAFSRTIELPAEVEPETADATEKHGLLILRLPKLDKAKRSSVRVKSV